MPDSASISFSQPPVKVWVLAPQLITNDENLEYYYDFSQSISEYTKVFSELNLHWKWQPVTMDNFPSVISEIAAEKETRTFLPIVFNICDGDEINGTPGISVVKLLQEEGLIFTGADDFFYDITTSKINMKYAFNKANIPTPAWQAIHSQEQVIDGIFEQLGETIILKPSVSGGSMGISIKNVVNNTESLKDQIEKLFGGYRGWNLDGDGLIAESYICGEEYTTLIVGSYNAPKRAIIYHPVERIFHQSLPDNERFLSFDRLWEIYEEESPMPEDGNFYEYSSPDPSLIEEIKKLSWDAFVSVKGTGYTRVDIRRDKNTGKMYVLEVNAQCGISEDENYTSIGAILKFSGKTFTDLVKEIIETALVKTKAVVAQKKKIKKAA